jgi:ribose transport system permease protein
MKRSIVEIERPAPQGIKKRISIDTLIPVLAFVILFLVFLIWSKGKLVSRYNLTNIIEQTIPSLIGGLGVIFVTATGSTDLSVGANAALSATIGAYLASRYGSWIMIPATLVIGCVVGLLNGFLVTKCKLSSFMTTLAMLISLRGLLNYILTLELITMPAPLRVINRFPVRFAILIILIAIMAYLFEYTKIGYYCKAMGENERTVIATGINAGKMRRIAFFISGLMAAVFGIIVMSKVGGSTNSLCQFMEMKIQMAIFLGGVLVTGGFGAKIYKLIIGSFTIVVIENGLMLCKVDATMSMAIQGILLMLVLFVTIYSSERSLRKT